LSFYIQFFGQHVCIIFLHALASTIKRKIALVGDAYCRPPIIIRFHDLHVSNFKKVVCEITYTTRGTSYFPSLVFMGYAFFSLSLAFHVMVLTIDFYCDPSFLLLDIITILNEDQNSHFSSTQIMIIKFHLANKGL
jgi:hypothetical protein